MKIFGFNTSKTAPDASAPTENPATQISVEPLSVSTDEAVADAQLAAENDLPVAAEAAPPDLPDLADVAEFPEDYGIHSTSDVPETLAELVKSEAGMDNSEAAPVGIEPPRALFPGSFLGGEYEIKEVISRGPSNFYLADAGDYGAHDFKIVAQRRLPLQVVESQPDAPFYAPATRFVDEENEFAVWDFGVLKSLEEWSAPPNDETYASVMLEVARGFLALEAAGLKADLPPGCLFFDDEGKLRYFGFFDASDETATGMTAIQQLSALSSRFAKNNLAARATLRLDDEFGALPFSDEVKAFARALNNGDFSSAAQVVAHLEGFALPGKTDSALQTDVGMERELNEDCGLIFKVSRAGHARNSEIEVLAVADGMGGHEGGEVASDVTLSALQHAIGKRQNLDFSDNGAVLSAMSEILSEVNDAVIRLTENPPYASMRNKPGATLVCALRLGSRLFVGNVGDSRAYKWNENSGLQRLTKDHSYVQDLLDSGSLTEEEAWGHPDGSVITSHIGLLRGFKKDVFLRLLARGDRVVLVSDGVVDTLRDAQIEAIIAAQGEPENLCAALVQAANGAGGFDNITVAALICK